MTKRWAIPLVLMLHACGPDMAFAAEPHGWIQDEPAYIAKGGSHCCGPEHCRQVAGDFATPTPGGWKIVATGQIMRPGDRGLYASADPESGGLAMWACIWGTPPEVKCLFVPGSGS